MTSLNNDKFFVCNQCNYKTDDKGNITRHKKSVHDKIKDVKCNQCNYKTDDNLKGTAIPLK